MKRALLAWVACALACGPGAPDSGEGRQSAIPSHAAPLSPDPSALGIPFAARLNAHRVGEAVQRYAEDAVLMAPNGDILRGRAAIEQYWTDLMAHGFLSLALQPFRSTSADSVAYEVGTYDLRMAAGSGSTVASGQFVTVYKRGEDGAWSVVYDVLNDLPQAPAPGSADAASPVPPPRP